MNFQYSNIFVAQKLSEWENFKDWHILQLDTHFRLIFPPSIVLRVDNIFFTAVFGVCWFFAEKSEKRHFLYILIKFAFKRQFEKEIKSRDPKSLILVAIGKNQRRQRKFCFLCFAWICYLENMGLPNSFGRQLLTPW